MNLEKHEQCPVCSEKIGWNYELQECSKCGHPVVTITIEKELFIDLLKSHSRLLIAEYNRDPSFNSSHPSYIVEEMIVNYLIDKGIEI